MGFNAIQIYRNEVMMMYEDIKAGDNVSTAKCQEQQADMTRKWGGNGKNRANVGKKKNQQMGKICRVSDEVVT